jgi:hypothetical protein
VLDYAMVSQLTAALAGVYNVVIITTFACGVITLATLAVDSATGIICLAAFYGFPAVPTLV